MNRIVAGVVIPLLSEAFYPPHLSAAAIEEVTVTATKRGETDVQSIAASINAISGDDLEAKGLTDFEDFAGSVPGLQFQDLGPGDKEYIIRGINGNGPAVVGAYFDEYVITASDQQDGGGKNAPIKMVDLQRVEVLNGPQGTLYGANSMAGNIKFIPRKPSADKFDAYVNTDLSGTKEGGFNYTLSGALNVPVIENTLAFRLVGWHTDNDGWIDQPRLQNGPFVGIPANRAATIPIGVSGSFNGGASDINDEQTNGGRLMLRWTPNARLTLDALYMKQDLEIGGSPRFTAKGSPAWPELPPALLAAVIAAPDANPPVPLVGLAAFTPREDFVNVDIIQSSRDDEVDLFGGTVAWEFDFGTATVSASHFDHDIVFQFDTTPVLLFLGVDVPGVSVQPQSYENTMVEARFASRFEGPINFVAGLYYQKDENDWEVEVSVSDGQGNAGGLPWNPLNSNDFFAGGSAFFGRERSDEIEQKAVFGEINFDFMDDRAHLLVGVRAFEAELESVQSTEHAFSATGLPQPVAGRVIGTNINGNDIGLIETNGNTIRPKVSVAFDFNQDIMVYGLYSEGFRVGGINNGNQPFAPGIPATFKSDELTNFEFGVKSQLLDDRLRANATAFFIDWEGMQVEPRDPLGNVPFTTNGGDAAIKGLEWAIDYLPADNLEFNLTGTYFFEHELTTDQPTLPGASTLIITGLEGDEVPNVPEVQLYASAKYLTRVFNNPLTLSADLTYRGDTNTEFRADDLFNIELDSFLIANLYANMNLNKNLTVGVYVKNLSDELAVYDGISTFEDPRALVAARPRTVGAALRWTF